MKALLPILTLWHAIFPNHVEIPADAPTEVRKTLTSGENLEALVDFLIKIPTKQRARMLSALVDFDFKRPTRVTHFRNIHRLTNPDEVARTFYKSLNRQYDFFSFQNKNQSNPVFVEALWRDFEGYEGRHDLRIVETRFWNFIGQWSGTPPAIQNQALLLEEFAPLDRFLESPQGLTKPSRDELILYGLGAPVVMYLAGEIDGLYGTANPKIMKSFSNSDTEDREKVRHLLREAHALLKIEAYANAQDEPVTAHLVYGASHDFTAFHGITNLTIKAESHKVDCSSLEYVRLSSR